jgi:hypothetical protein
MQALAERVLTVLAAIITACIVLAAGGLIWLDASRGWRGVLAIAVVGGGWLLRYRYRAGGDAQAARRRRIVRAIVVAGGLLLVALGRALAARLGWNFSIAGFLP